MRVNLWLAYLAVVCTACVVACGGHDASVPGTRLAACDGATPASCSIAWQGGDTGSSSCSVSVVQSSTATSVWQIWVTGGGAASVTAAVELAGAPSGGDAIPLSRALGASVVLDRGSGHWSVNKSPPPAATTNIAGDLMLTIQDVVPGSGSVHGTIAAVLAPEANSGADVTMCIAF